MVNKYRRWYDRLITRAAKRQLNEYTEDHHIVPRCLGGNNDPSNLVTLTYREHFLAHWLLIKFTKGKAKDKMRVALFCMTRRRNKRLTSGWQYALAKRADIKAKQGKRHTIEHRRKISARLIGNQNTLGYKHTQQTREKVSAAMKQIKSTPENKLKMSLVNRGNTYLVGYKHTKEARKKISAIHKGRKFSTEHRAKISAARKRYFAKQKEVA